jgi:hypothetical protein
LALTDALTFGFLFLFFPFLFSQKTDKKLSSKLLDTEKTKEKKSEKSKDSESEHEKLSNRIVHTDTSLLRAFQFFDRSRVGYLRSDDVETLIHSLGLGLSKRYVSELINKVIDSSSAHPHRIYYKPLTETVLNISSSATKMNIAAVSVTTDADDSHKNDRNSTQTDSKDNKMPIGDDKPESVKEESVASQESQVMATSSLPLLPQASVPAPPPAPSSVECPDTTIHSQDKVNDAVDSVPQTDNVTQQTDNVMSLEAVTCSQPTNNT